MYRISVTLILGLLFVLSPSVWAETQCIPGSEARAYRSLALRLLNETPARRHLPSTPGEVAVGVEIEGLIPRSLEYDDAAKHIQQTLQRRCRDCRYIRVIGGIDAVLVTYSRNNQTYTWQIKYDPTIRHTPSTKAVEIVSPILRDETDRRMFVDVIASLHDEVGLQATPHSAGMHVHVDYPDPQGAEIGATSQIFAELEPDLDRVFQATDSRRPHIRTVGPDTAAVLSVLESNHSRHFSDVLRMIGSRKRMLNWRSLERHGTAEFRFFNSTVRADVMLQAMEFSANFIHAVRTRDPRLVTYLQSLDAGESVTLQGIAGALELSIGRDAERIMALIADEIQADPALQAPQPLPEDLVSPQRTLTRWARAAAWTERNSIAVATGAGVVLGIGPGLLVGIYQHQSDEESRTFSRYFKALERAPRSIVLEYDSEADLYFWRENGVTREALPGSMLETFVIAAHRQGITVTWVTRRARRR